jgi:hypothetical protein
LFLKATIERGNMLKDYKNSTQVLTEASRAAEIKVQPPKMCQLTDKQREYFDQIVSTRAADLWQPNDLLMAVILARSYADLEQVYAEIETTNDRIVYTKSSEDTSARHKVARDLETSIVRYSRILHIHPVATQGKAGESVGKNSAYQKAQQTRDAFMIIWRSLAISFND